MPEFTYSCQRARALAAHDLDGELSEAEAHLLQRHLARCPSCAAFAGEIAGIAALMRETPLERFSLELQPRARRPRRSARRAGLLGVTTVVSVAALAVAAGIPLSEDPGPASPKTVFSSESPPGERGGLRRGVPVVTRLVLPLGQLNAVDDF